jgi:hypothetical protein
LHQNMRSRSDTTRQHRELRLPQCRVFDRDQEEDSDFGALLLQDAHRCRDVLISDIQFLLCRPDICHRMRRLHLSLGWSRDGFMRAHIASDNVDFFGPLLQGFADVLSACAPLVEVTLASFNITIEIIVAMVDLHSLRTVSLLGMGCSPPVWDVAAAAALPHCMSVLEMDVYWSCQDIWPFLALFPNLVTLGVQYWHHWRHLGITEGQGAVRAFEGLKRISLLEFGGVNTADFVPLCTWLTSIALACPGATLPLTHLYLMPARFLCDEERDAFIHLLPFIPTLEALVLERVQHLRAEDVARIARAAPRGLCGLTLTLKPNAVHERAAPCIWPGAGHEYAAALAPLINLREFRWNSFASRRVPAPGRDLRCFEDGYPSEPPCPPGVELWIPSCAPDGDVWFGDDGDSLLAADAREFAAYLPALERLAWAHEEPDSVIESVCYVARDDKRLRVKTRYVGLARGAENEPTKYYPDVRFRPSWPLPGKACLRDF